MNVPLPAISSTITASSSGFDDFVLQLLRRAYCRSRQITNTIETAGTALSGGLCDGESALAICAESGVLQFVTLGSSS